MKENSLVWKFIPFFGESVTKRIQNYHTGTKTQHEKYNFITVTCIQKFCPTQIIKVAEFRII